MSTLTDARGLPVGLRSPAELQELNVQLSLSTQAANRATQLRQLVAAAKDLDELFTAIGARIVTASKQRKAFDVSTGEALPEDRLQQESAKAETIAALRDELLIQCRVLVGLAEFSETAAGKLAAEAEKGAAAAESPTVSG